MKNKAIKVNPILSNEERHFYKQSTLCDAYGWCVRQFNNHKYKQENKQKYVYKGHKIETIIIE